MVDGLGMIDMTKYSRAKLDQRYHGVLGKEVQLEQYDKNCSKYDKVGNGVHPPDAATTQVSEFYD